MSLFLSCFLILLLGLFLSLLLSLFLSLLLGLFLSSLLLLHFNLEAGHELAPKPFLCPAALLNTGLHNAFRAQEDEFYVLMPHITKIAGHNCGKVEASYPL